MKILYCIPWVSGPGGVNRVVSIKANWLVKHGYDVSLVCTEEKGIKSFYEYDPRVQIHYIPMPGWLFPPSETTLFSKIEARIKRNKIYRSLAGRLIWTIDENKYIKLFKALKPDIIIVQSGGFVPAEAMINYRKHWNPNVKLVLEAHEFRFYREILDGTYPHVSVGYLTTPLLDILKSKLLFRPLIRRNGDYQYEAMDAVVALTQEDAKNYPTCNVKVIHNPITISPISTIEFNENLKYRKKRIIAAGRNVPRKNFVSLLRIWELLYPQYPDWSLAIYGDLVPNLEPLTQGLERVELYDTTSNIKAEYLKSSIYALTSKSEGFALVLVEAQAMGVPSVSYNCLCGPSDIISDGKDGFLIEPGDEQEFAHKLGLLMQDEKLLHQMSLEALESSKRLNLELIMQQWVDFFDAL